MFTDYVTNRIGHRLEKYFCGLSDKNWALYDPGAIKLWFFEEERKGILNLNEINLENWALFDGTN
ncbi:hypothetical protein BpHYR1_050916 [Brachionus plicatilis]|uniref:Uncharacterized protein n=1 Tax=Brachionus plicatilis TaxID=10195 RepID=A0A3M7RJT7_BRAPC|nr:hypothetical protein BpHYR1_050916 [Brachionus plicatilis]